MLKIINNLEPFFEDCYKRINVREYSRIKKMSPPTASKFLEKCKNEGLLIKEKDRIYLFYSANKNSRLFIDMSRIYWNNKLENVFDLIEQEYISPVIILFGSLSKAEVKSDSDVDIAVFSVSKKEIGLKELEKKRKIQLFVFKDRDNVKNKELLNNILNGYKARGSW